MATESDTPESYSSDTPSDPNAQAEQPSTEAEPEHIEEAPSDKPRSRKERRDYFVEAKTLREQNEQLTRSQRDLMYRLDAMTQAQQAMMQRWDKSIPAPPDPVKEQIKGLRQKAFAALARVDSDKGALDEYHDTLEEISRAVADSRFSEREKKLREEITSQFPRETSPEIRALEGRYPWLMEHEESVVVNAKYLAKRDGRDMSNSKIFASTVAEAAAMVAKAYGLPVGGGSPRSPSGSFGGPGGKTSMGQNDPDAPQLDDRDVQKVADHMYGNAVQGDDEASKAKRRAMWYASAGKHVGARR